MLTDTKPASRSLGVWGGAIAAVAGLAGLVGWTVSPDDAAQLGQQADTIAGGLLAVVQAVTSLVAMVGGAAAVVGRLRATARIGDSADAGPTGSRGI